MFKGRDLGGVGVSPAAVRRLVGVMAVNLLMPLLIPLGEQITNVTHLSNVGNLAFPQPWMEVSVKENIAPVLLLTLHATTNTTNKNVLYSIVGGTINGLFFLDSHTGELTLTTPLDYEIKNNYEMIVGALTGEERAFARVVVNVRDVNDLPPTFSRPLFETQITEEDDRHLPKSILQVAANDGDISDENRLSYTLSIDDVPNPNKTFTITNNTGHIHLLRALDRDAPNGRPRWHLRVTVTDGLHTAHALVHVNIKDINDNAPFFPNNVINATVMENSAAGTEVIQVEATDYDDPEESTNAILSYSVEKNVIDEHSGQPIFTIDSQSGRLRTARCCLDRERTPSYAIQLVAADGGGLKGTGTVVVVVGDQNDVAPRFSRPEWLLTVHETVSLNTTLALLTVEDPDITNHFLFKVIPGSGYGWEKFQVVSVGNGSGALQLLEKLDFEDPDQRRGFRFKVKVSDKGELGWNDIKHQSETWVVVEVVDDNDNNPSFFTQAINLTLSEDTSVGRSLATFSASDTDQGVAGDVHYTIEGSSDPDRQFVVDSLGVVRLRRPLDRETSPTHAVRVLAVDGGHPPLTATASLLITVTDINDNAPHVANPDNIYVPENTGPRHVANLLLDDADDWALGHGPPFTVSLDNSAPRDIKKSFALYFNNEGSANNGVVVLKSLMAMDREESPQRLVPLVLSDAEGLTTTATITVTIADANDNLMKPAAKTVTVTKFTDAIGRISLGRVYVDDPDDWDAGEKRWSWNQRRHHLFALNDHSGRLTMKGNASDGRYLLQFLVSDPTHRQINITANVTVLVSSLDRDIINCAVPLLITTHSPEGLITSDQNTKSSPLDALRASVESVAGVGVAVVSLEADPVAVPNTKRSFGTRVWLSARPSHPLDQLLLLHRRQISNEAGLEVVDVGMGSCVSLPSSVRSLRGEMEVEESVWVVDANVTALVTPVLATHSGGCNCHDPPKFLHHHQHHYHHHYQHHLQGYSGSVPAHQPNVAAITHINLCQSNPCLNGGRCIASFPTPRCVCPSSTTGSICKQLSRHFRGGGWAWAAPIPSSKIIHVSLEFRTTRKDSLMLYTGPRDDHYGSQLQHHHSQEDVLSVELRNGRPQVLLDLGTGPLLLHPSDTSTLADGRWHRLDIFWGNQRAEIVVDLCQTGRIGCRAGVPLPPEDEGLDVGAPLQVGGLAHPPPLHKIHGWPHSITSTSFLGCIRNLRINGELRDLGKGVLGMDSVPGCPQDDQCRTSGNPCPLHARCVDSLDGKGGVCECEPGWTTESCSQRTQPTSFGAKSYVKVALSSTPPMNTTKLQLRFRTWEKSSQMLAVTSQHGRDLFTIQLMKGRLCIQLLLYPAPLTQLCLQRLHLNDGRWHHVMVRRYGEWVELQVDEGDGDFYNATATPATSHGWASKLLIDRHEGIHVGGSPEYVGVSLYTVHHDFHHGCLDDLRVSGISLPLPPLVNTSSWAQATMFTNIQAGCPGTPSVCANVSCPQPLTCIDLWRRHHCGCGDGAALSADGESCRDINECLWSPCLNGGTCINQDPGYFCVCADSNIGEHCEGAALTTPVITISIGALVAILSWILLLFVVVVAAWLVQRRRRQSRMKTKAFTDEVALELTSTDDTLPNNLDITKTTNPNGKMSSRPTTGIADVDVLNGSGKSVSSKDCGCSHAGNQHDKEITSSGHGGTQKGCGCPNLPSVDDLRNYAYEGDGSSPGSLSSCCSGGDKVGEGSFLGGFQDVATLLNCLGGQSTSYSPKHQQSMSSQKSYSNQLPDQPSHHTVALLSTNARLPSSSAHVIHPNKNLLTPDLTSSTPQTTLVLPSKNNWQRSDVDNIQKNMLDSNIKYSQPVSESKFNSLPRSKPQIVFVNNLHQGETTEGKGPPIETYHYSLKRNKSPVATSGKNYYMEEGTPAPCYCEHKLSAERLDDSRTNRGVIAKGKCGACVRMLLQQQEDIVGGIPKRSFSASTVFYLSPSCTCMSAPTCQSASGAQSSHPSCSSEGYCTSPGKEGATSAQASSSRQCLSRSNCQWNYAAPTNNSSNSASVHLHVMADLYNASRK